MSAALAERIQHELLPRVSKPNRYLGNALHVPRKDLAAADVRVLLAFPDAYEIGLSNLGIRIIHHVLNQRADVAAELAFAPRPGCATSAPRSSSSTPTRWRGRSTSSASRSTTRSSTRTCSRCSTSPRCS